MTTFYTYDNHGLHMCSDPSNIFNEINYLESLAFFLKDTTPLSLITPWKPLKPKLSISPPDSYPNLVLLPIFSSSLKISRMLLSISHPDTYLNPVLLLIFASSLKISRMLSRFAFKLLFKPVNNIEFSSLKDLIFTEYLFYSSFFLYSWLYRQN